MAAVRRVMGSRSVRLLVTLLHNTRGPMPPRDPASLAGRQIRSSCSAHQTQLSFLIVTEEFVGAQAAQPSLLKACKGAPPSSSNMPGQQLQQLGHNSSYPGEPGVSHG
jgi:hypothetical protein